MKCKVFGFTRVRTALVAVFKARRTQGSSRPATLASEFYVLYDKSNDMSKIFHSLKFLT